MAKKSFTASMVSQSFQDRFGGTKVHAQEVTYFFQELMQQELYRGYSMKFPMLGTFTPYKRKARTARNPKTGEPAQVLAQFRVKFKPSKKMIAWLNKNR